MASLASAFPILPGKLEDWKQFSRDLTGARREQYEASRRRLGITRECAYHQVTPAGDTAVIYLEASDPARAFQGLGMSNDPFDDWFRQRVMELHGLDLTQPPPGPLPETIHEWDAPA